jgi:hypothetical protein
MRVHVICLLAVCLVSGCATSSRQSTSSRERERIIHAAEKALGDVDGMIAMDVGSFGPQQDLEFIRTCRKGGTSPMAQKVAQTICGFEGQQKKILLFGSNSSRTLQVAMDALRMCEDRAVEGVTFGFCGKQSDFDRLEKSADKFPGILRFVKQP